LKKRSKKLLNLASDVSFKARAFCYGILRVTGPRSNAFLAAFSAMPETPSRRSNSAQIFEG
jgi:hypothetical protein